MHSPKRRRFGRRLPNAQCGRSGLYLLILITLCFPLRPHAATQDDGDLLALQNQKRALELELACVGQLPGRFYLVIDAAAQRVYLKADANVLRTCPIRNTMGHFPPTTQKLHFAQRLDPQTIEPGNNKHRLRGRPLPLDFRGRLIEGPRNQSRLFVPPIYLHTSSDLRLSTPSIVLDAADIKALGSALDTNHVVIWIPSRPVSESAP